MATERLGALLSSEANAPGSVQGTVNSYEAMFESGTAEDRKATYMNVIQTYYNLATPFYEWAWGQSFHFAPQDKGESYDAALARYEHKIALKLGLKPGMRVLDVGCGVGGPARSIARFSGATIIGVNNSDYQIARATKLTEDAGLTQLVSFVKADFHDIAEKFEKESFDAIFSIEATVHSPTKTKLYKAIHSLLKPGGKFMSGEWVLTAQHDDNNADHKLWAHLIEKGNGLPALERDSVVKSYYSDAGFINIEDRDTAQDSHVDFPWYHPLTFSLTPKGFLHTRFGHYITHYLVRVMETVHLAAPGSTDVSRILMEGAVGLVESGRHGTFTPMYMVLATKPAH